MSEESAERAAWLAFEEGRLEDADLLWSGLIASAGTEAERDRFIGQHGYVLVAQRRFDEARAGYERLFARTRSHKHLHQVGMVEREAGNLDEALRLFQQEASLIPPDDDLAGAANLYEQALLHHISGDEARAVPLMRRCLTRALRSDDWTMLGVAYRLKGDVLTGSAPDRARSAFARSRDCFERAGDRFGVAEIERRLSARP